MPSCYTCHVSFVRPIDGSVQHHFIHVGKYLFPHPGWIAARAPHRENRQNFRILGIFSVHGKIALRWPQIGPGGFFPTNPDLADILGRTDLNFEDFLIFWIPMFWISRSPDLQISGCTGPQISNLVTQSSINKCFLLSSVLKNEGK